MFDGYADTKLGSIQLNTIIQFSSKHNKLLETSFTQILIPSQPPEGENPRIVSRMFNKLDTTQIKLKQIK